jgi:hypothetical protein
LGWSCSAIRVRMTDGVRRSGMAWRVSQPELRRAKAEET